MSKESLTVSGTVRVRNSRAVGAGNQALPSESPLSLAAVRVQAKPRVGVWRDIGETNTDFAGHFSVTSTNRESDWRFRIDVRLKADDLVVRQHTNADWDTVLEQPEPRGDDLNGVVLIFGNRAGSSTDALPRLDDSEDRERAEVWVIARRALKKLRDLGAPFSAALVRPYTLEIVSPSLTTYASPATRNVHVVSGESALNIIHESMHIWAYDHTRPLTGGQGGLIPSGTGGGTHEQQEAESTAFHEGFAQFAARQLLHLEFGLDAPLPLNRASLGSQGLTTIDKLIRSDHGWETILTTLVTPNLHRFDFGSASGSPGTITQTASPSTACQSPSTSFQALLSTFATAETLGVKDRLSRTEMKDLSKYLERVCKMLRGTMLGQAGKFLQLLNPAETIEPRTLFCP